MRKIHLLSSLLVLALIFTACAAPAAAPQAPADGAAVDAAPADATAPAAEGGDQTLVFWTTEEQPERAAKAQVMLDRFQAETGITVEMVLTNEDQLPNLITAAVAADTLPDVIFMPVEYAVGWEQQGIIDPAVANEAIEALGVETFAQGALDLVRVDGVPVAVPSDGWGQILLYRADIFDEMGLARPDTFAAIQAAAEALHDPANNFYGIALSSDPGAVFTQQTFEHFALANNCQLTDDAGNITLDSPECVEAIRFFTDLVENYGPAGVQDVSTTRATYFAGQSGMLVWSPFILDEMAGLRDNAFPACPECADDPAYLAVNSGIVPAFQGPDSDAPAQYGQVSYLGVSTTANVELAKQFIDYWFNEGYLDMLSLSVEGKFPMRQGTPEDPDAFVEGWKALETGVDRQAPLSDFYSADTIQQLVDGAAIFQRWGFNQGQGALVAALYESLAVPQALRDVVDGSMTPEEAAAEIQAAAEDLQ
jgi:multiple sugar transport system substrate-binding protein